MQEKTLITCSLVISLIGLIIISFMEAKPQEEKERNITLDYCSRKDGNTYLFFSEKKENKAIFEGDFPCETNQRISIKGEESGEWFQVHSIKVLE